MKRKISCLLCVICTLSAAGCSDSESLIPDFSTPETAWEAAGDKTDIPRSVASKETTITTAVTTAVAKPSSLLDSAEDIDLHDIDGEETNYIFTYGGKEFEAVYTPDNWHITDSYRITDTSDITLICQALSDVHPIHDKDRNGYRTAEDLAYEWLEHNKAYNMLSDSSEWKAHVKDVDLDPDDQGKSIMDMAMDRLNKENE